MIFELLLIIFSSKEFVEGLSNCCFRLLVVSNGFRGCSITVLQTYIRLITLTLSSCKQRYHFRNITVFPGVHPLVILRRVDCNIRAKNGGLGLPHLRTKAETQYKTLKLATEHLIESIVRRKEHCSATSTH